MDNLDKAGASEIIKAVTNLSLPDHQVRRNRKVKQNRNDDKKEINMNYKILFLDIDGTILKPDHTYTASTKDAIAQLKEQDIEVFLATGRPLHEVEDLAAELQIQSFIGYNGAYAVHQNETIVNEPMDTSVMKEFLNIAEEKGHQLVCYTSQKNYFTSLSD